MKKEITLYLKPKKVKKHFANYVVFVSLFAVSIYTIGAFILQYQKGLEISPTLTTCFYSFFGVELASLALIKHSKSKYLQSNVNYTQQSYANQNNIDTQFIDSGGK